MLTVILSGFGIGAIYVLAAQGYALTYMSSGVVNFAQGYLVMLGTFSAYIGLNTLHLPVPVTVILAAAIGGFANAVVERICIRPLKKRNAHAEILTTIGAATVIGGIIQIVWGTNPLGLNLLNSSIPVHVAGALVPVIVLWLLGISVVVTLGLILVTRRTQIGMVSQAVAEDREAATLRGINVNRLSLGAFIVAGLLAGAVGPATGVETGVIITLGALLAVKGFVVLTLGGTRSYGGALVCGLAIGILEAAAARYLNAPWQDVTTFVVFLLVIIIRPQGLFGHLHERAV